MSGPCAHPTYAGAAILLLACAAIAGTAQAAHDETDWAGATAAPLVHDAAFPADIAIASDGTLWFIEVYSGDVLRLPAGSDTVELVHHVDSVSEQDERGLVGLALSPDHDQTGAFYLYYTAPNEDPDGGVNRIVRVQDGKETILATVPGKDEHNGGRMVFTPEGTLFVGTGENQLRDPAQDEGSPLGKILRMTSDGKPVEGNLEGLVYSKGHRNVYGLAYDPATGQLWNTENSGWRRDEVNIIEAHGNYGYPECEGHGLNGVDPPCPTDKGYTFPIMTFYEDRTAAPTGAAFWRGGFYWGSLREGTIHHTWSEDGTWQDAVVHTQPPAILDVEAGPDGSLYFSTVDTVYRLVFPGEPEGETERPAATRSSDPPGPGGPSPAGPAGIPALPVAMAVAMLAGLALRRR